VDSDFFSGLGSVSAFQPDHDVEPLCAHNLHFAPRRRSFRRLVFKSRTIVQRLDFVFCQN
jgi:hypothetical protein